MMTDTQTMITDGNVRAIASVALRRNRAVNFKVLDHWKIDTDVWLVNFLEGIEGIGQRTRVTATVLPRVGGFAVAWYDPWGAPLYGFVKTVEVS